MSYVRYIDKTREYYRGAGYERPYEWAHFEDIPFVRPPRPLAECRVGLATTSEMALVGEAGIWDDNPGCDVYALPTDTPVDRLYSKKESYDRYATTLDDVDSYLPLTRLGESVTAGRIGSLAPRFQVIYSQYSQRKTMTVDAPEILRQMREDGVDVAVLTAIWPVCHQTASLAARHLEANGIPTVLFGCARDIVECCGVPRFVFSDFPLGNPTGRPFDPTMQRDVLELGFGLLETATTPGATVVNPHEWSPDHSWKDRVFTKAQPFLSEDATEKWLKRKQAYRELRTATGT